MNGANPPLALLVTVPLFCVHAELVGVNVTPNTGVVDIDIVFMAEQIPELSVTVTE